MLSCSRIMSTIQRTHCTLALVLERALYEGPEQKPDFYSGPSLEYALGYAGYRGTTL